MSIESQWIIVGCIFIALFLVGLLWPEDKDVICPKCNGMGRISKPKAGS